MRRSKDPAQSGVPWVAIGRTILAVLVTAFAASGFVWALERVHGGNIYAALLLAAFPAIAIGIAVGFGTIRHAYDLVRDVRLSLREGPARRAARQATRRARMGRVVVYHADDVSISIVPARLRGHYLAEIAYFNDEGPVAPFPVGEPGGADACFPLIGAGVDLAELEPVLDRLLPRYDLVVDVSAGYGSYELPFGRFPAWGFHEGEALFVSLKPETQVGTLELQLSQIEPLRLDLWADLLSSLQQITDLLLVDTDRGHVIPLDDRAALRVYLQRATAELDRGWSGPDSP